jgi:isopentenyldiphosphate isomerase
VSGLPQPVAQDPAELLDIVRPDGTPTGHVKARAAVHRDGDWHRAVHVWVYGSDAAGPFLLMQRRSSEKDTWPDRLDVTVGGHLRAGEGVAEALREVEEEIGLAPPPGAPRRLGARYSIDPGERDRELQEVYAWRHDAPLTAYRPNPAELTALLKLPLPPLLDLLAGDRSSLQADSLRASDLSLHPVAIGPDDFIPSLDRYVYRAAIAVSHLLFGERHVAI